MDKCITLKNNSPFTLCITKINNTFIDSAEDLDIIKKMHHVLDHSDNYLIILWHQQVCAIIIDMK